VAAPDPAGACRGPGRSGSRPGPARARHPRPGRADAAPDRNDEGCGQPGDTRCGLHHHTDGSFTSRLPGDDVRSGKTTVCRHFLHWALGEDAGPRRSRPWRHGQSWPDRIRVSAMRQPEAAGRATAVTSSPVACQACRRRCMREDIDPVQWVGQQAVVALPVPMDASNAGQVREELLSVINGGATTLIADMTATTSCDHAGADAVVRAFPACRHRRHRVAAGGHRRACFTRAPPQRPGPSGPYLPVPGSGHSRQPAGGGARRGGQAGVWWQQIMGESTVGYGR